MRYKTHYWMSIFHRSLTWLWPTNGKVRKFRHSRKRRVCRNDQRWTSCLPKICHYTCGVPQFQRESNGAVCPPRFDNLWNNSRSIPRRCHLIVESALFQFCTCNIAAMCDATAGQNHLSTERWWEVGLLFALNFCQ